jgi:hypothetical protein
MQTIKLVAEKVRKNLDRLNRLNEEVLKKAFIKVTDDECGYSYYEDYEDFERRFYDLLKEWNQMDACVKVHKGQDNPFDDDEFEIDCRDFHIFCCDLENWFRTRFVDEIA